MDTFAQIRSLYQPQQPSIRPLTSAVSYREAWPDPSLRNMIYCYWQLKTDQALKAPFQYRVVADGCIDVYFDLQDTRESFVMGFCKQYTAFELPPTFNYVGIRFLPSMFTQVFGIDSKSLSDQYVQLELVIPSLARHLMDHMSGLETFKDLASKLDLYFLSLMSNLKLNEDGRFYQALALILKHGGTLDTEKELDTGLSPRQLRRVFNYYVGTTPKTFSRVVRFQQILHAKPSTQSLHKSKIFYDLGYFDQAHFIKDFKRLYGVTPTEAFR